MPRLPKFPIAAFFKLAMLLGLLSAAPAQAAAIVVNSNVDDSLANLALNSTCDLREAIVAANTDAAVGQCSAGSGADTITFAANDTITLTNLLPAVVSSSTITVTGKGAANTIIQASTCNPVTLPGGCTPASYGIFVVNVGGNLTLDGLTVRNGSSTRGSVFNDSSSAGVGTLTVKNATLSDNKSTLGGGAIGNLGSLTVTNSSFSGNSSITGGAIFIVHLSASTDTVTNSTFTGNSATGASSVDGSGGAIMAGSGTLIVTNSTFSGNTSTRSGGAIANTSGGTVAVTGSTFSGNSDTGNQTTYQSSGGGGVFNDAGGTLTVTNSSFTGNKASLCGGGIHNTGALTVTNSSFSGNTTGASGGGICNTDQGGTDTVSNSTFSGNKAVGGGGIVNDLGGTLVVTNSTFSANAATSYGGGINNQSLNNGSTLVVKNSTFSSNVASFSPYHGAGIYNASGGTLTLQNNIITNGLGGGDCVNDGVISPSSNNLIKNSVNANACDLVDGVNGNILGSDPLLSALGDHGGPTQTFALLPGSPAIGAGDNTTCAATDQRGVTRPQGATCDIGAYEVNYYAVTYASGGGTGTLPTQADVASGATFTVASGAGLSRTGYEFSGWNDGTSAYAAGVTYTMGVSNVILTAQWIVSIPPTVNTFAATSPFGSLNIPITAFTASDNVGVTGFMITVTATPPAASAAGWSATAPTTYTVASAGSYTLYPWAKDAAGNVSAVYGSPASVTVNTTVPTVDTFAATSPSSHLSIPITAFTASDNVGVTGYMITETATPPAASASGWLGTAPTAYTVASSGSYTLYPWAKDAVGNVSAVYGSPASVTVNTTVPMVDAFAATLPASGLDISISAFTASDNVGVTGYMITEIATPPAAGAAGWSGTAPTTYTVAGTGSHTLYPWAKNAVGKVSAVYGSPASFTLRPTTYKGATATGSGTATATVSGGVASCGFTSARFVAPDNGPLGIGFPQGLFDFTLDGCPTGGTVTLTVTYPDALPAGSHYWKYGPTPGGGINDTPHWYKIPATISGNTATFSITDGGLGDDDLTANGTIVDQGGPGYSLPISIPTLSEWAILLLTGLLGWFGFRRVRA